MHVRFRESLSLIQNLVSRLRKHDLPSLSAQMSYYLLLAFFPFLIFLFSLLGYMNLSEEELLGSLQLLLPKDAGESVRTIVQEATANRSGTLLSFGLIGALWTSSGGVNAIIKALNQAYDEPETRRIWLVRLISLASTLVLALVILVTMGLLVFGQAIERHGFPLLGIPERWGRWWDVLQFTVPVLALYFVFLLLYRMTPNRRLNWVEVMPGSIFASAGWIVSSLLFSFYVNNFGHFSRTYGSLGGVIILLIWLYLSSIIVLVGGELNAALARKNR